MKRYKRSLAGTLALVLALQPSLTLAFGSGSTGADGPFSPTVNTELDLSLKPSGVYNFTTINIPAGVTVTFKRNSANTPVVFLASGDVTIAGTLDARGKAAPGVGAAGDGNQGDDSQPGAGGPGAFAGGKGGTAGVSGAYGGTGLGPGAGQPGFFSAPGAPLSPCIDGSGWAVGGTGGGFGAPAANSERTSFTCGAASYTGQLGGVAYGTSLLLPLIGGSGGGGGGGGVTFDGGGGGGGGGAILIASSGTVTVSATGAILADGGAGAAASGGGIGGAGGGGAGGAIRIIATTIAGNGPISATGGAAGTISGQSYSVYNATAGAVGRIRLEADTITRTAATTPLATSDVPGSVFLANMPTLTITSVNGQPAPANPTGNADITLPASTTNPVPVTFATTNVPVGNTVRLTVTPQYGTTTSIVSPAITGTTENGQTSVSVSLPLGPSVLQAQTTYTIVAALGEQLRYYAGNERVEKLELTATFGGPSTLRLISVSGKSYEVPQAVLATLGM